LFQSQHKISELKGKDLNIDAEFIELEFTSHRLNFLSAEVESKTPLLIKKYREMLHRKNLFYGDNLKKIKVIKA
jgi:hypothetical protein